MRSRKADSRLLVTGVTIGCIVEKSHGKSKQSASFRLKKISLWFEKGIEEGRKKASQGKGTDHGKDH
jgi:hypothetical protein